MKKLALILAITPLFAHSGEQGGYNQHHQPAFSSVTQELNVNQYQHSSASANASASTSSASSANGGNVNVDNDVAASSTVTGSSNTTAKCWRYDSTSGSFIFAGLTKTLMIRDLVCTLGEPLNPEQKIALCLENSDYRKLRNIMKAPCEQ